MTRYLLDSDAVIDFLAARAPALALVERLNRTNGDLCTCAVVISEVFAGLPPDRVEIAWTFLGSLIFLPSVPEIGRQAGEWRYNFARKGQTFHTPDMLIAATALEHRAVLVTGNARHFRMPEVTVLPLLR